MYASDELNEFPKQFERIFSALENDIMLDIINRIQENDEITRTADWQAYRLVQLGKTMDSITKKAKEALKLSSAEIERLYGNVLSEGYARDEELYKVMGKKFVSFDENKQLQQLIQAVKKQTNAEFTNITDTMGFAVKNASGKTEYQPMKGYLQKVLDEAIMHTLNGSYDYNSIVKKVVNDMTNSGVRSINYESGVSNRIDVAARRAVVSGLNQVTAKISEDNMEQLDTKYVEVSWHSTARPTHQVWQGRAFYWDKENPETESIVNGVLYKSFIKETGYGTVEGLCGANCYHIFYSFIPGISVRNYTDEELDKMNADENKKRIYNGKEYTKYEASQYQRHLERVMRKQRQDIKLLKESGLTDNDDEVIYARCRYRKTSAKYRDFCKTMELLEQRERIYLDGLKDIGKGKYTTGLKNAVGKSIIEVKRNSLKGEPNSITQKVSKKGGIERNYYDENGRQYKQIANNNHGNSKMHPYGKKGEHSHDYVYDEKGNLIDRPIRELSADERKENGDIL